MLELKDVCFQVNEDAKDKEILKNINLKLDDRFVAITGPNGGGKSTLARVIAGIGAADQRKDLSGRRGYHRLFHYRARKSRDQLRVSAAGTL